LVLMLLQGRSSARHDELAPEGAAQAESIEVAITSGSSSPVRASIG
jgi:hypothetical protein